MSRWTWLVPCVALLTTGCGADFEAGVLGGGSLGATPGGSQDIGLARDVIEEGGVPTSAQFTVEGLYSEHALDLADPAPCLDVLCLDAASAYEVAVDDRSRDLFVQIGMASNLSLDGFERKPLNLGIVIDTSGSMGAVLPELRFALHALVETLNPDDRIALIEFESTANVILASTPVANKSALDAAIDTIRTKGSTNMEEGMELGYEQIAPFVDDTHASRLMVFTDAMTNTGSTAPGTFMGMATEAADQGIGLTFFGFGGGFDAAFIDDIAHVRGANYRFVRPEDVEPIFRDEIDFLVTPLAYDLRVVAQAPAAAPIVDVYGVPQAVDTPPGSLIDVATVFASKRKGGIVIRLQGDDLASIHDDGSLSLGQLSLSYEDVNGQAFVKQLEPTLSSAAIPEESVVPSPQIARTVSVTNQFLAMRDACDSYHGQGFDPAAAAASLDAAIAQLEAAHASTSDPNLQREIELLDKLKENMGL